MPSAPTTQQLADRVDSIEDRLDRMDEVLAVELHEFKKERDHNPKKKRRKLSPESREALRKNAAKARASKPVGKGRGAVSSAAVKKKLKEQR